LVAFKCPVKLLGSNIPISEELRMEPPGPFAGWVHSTVEEGREEQVADQVGIEESQEVPGPVGGWGLAAAVEPDEEQDQGLTTPRV
jgi:hypothetical protein